MAIAIPCGGCGRDGCRLCWLAQHDPRYRKAFGLTGNTTPKKSTKLDRPVRCLHLLKRTEFKRGCGGMKCRHECDLGLPAVPGIYCQSCEKYEPDAGAWV